MTARVAVLFLAVVPLWPQSRLTVADAVRMALDKHPAVEAAGAQTRAAEARIAQARSGYLPRISAAESFARSDNPVFVFSSLLTQRQFTDANFQIGSLNRPDFLNNFQSQISVEQTVFDWGATRAGVAAASLGRDASREGERRTRLNLAARAARAYYGAVLAGHRVETAAMSVRSAEADLDRARSIRAAGMSTDADVLALRVHAAAMREAAIRASADSEVAQAALNETLGLPLETAHQLASALDTPQAKFEAKNDAVSRPEVRQLLHAAGAAERQAEAARASWLPQVSLRGMFEADRQRFVTRGGANWLLMASVRWNVFDGFSSRARAAESQATAAWARAQAREAETGARLEVRRALALARAARERVGVSGEAVAQAEEGLRILKNRFDAGLANVTDLLRAENAVHEARLRRLAALHDDRVAAVEIALADGTLTADSEVLQ